VALVRAGSTAHADVHEQLQRAVFLQPVGQSFQYNLLPVVGKFPVFIGRLPGNDVRVEDEAFEVITAPEDFRAVVEAIKGAGLKIAEAEISMIPQSTVRLEGEQAEKCLGLVEALEDHEDVQNVYTNYDTNT